MRWRPSSALKASTLRIQAGTLYTLMKQIDDGHVYYPRRALVEQTCSQLGIAEEFVEEAVDCLAREERVVLEELDDEIGVYLTRFHHYESKIAYYLRRILASPKSVPVPQATKWWRSRVPARHYAGRGTA